MYTHNEWHRLSQPCTIVGPAQGHMPGPLLSMSSIRLLLLFCPHLATWLNTCHQASAYRRLCSSSQTQPSWSGSSQPNVNVAGAEYSRLQADAENARRSQQRLYEIANSPSGNPPRPILTQEFTTKTVISPGPIEKVRAFVLQLARHSQVVHYDI